MATKSLAHMRPKERGRITKVGGSGHTHRRILDMGVVPSTEVTVERVAQLGDPIEIKIKGYDPLLLHKAFCLTTGYGQVSIATHLQ